MHRTLLLLGIWLVLLVLLLAGAGAYATLTQVLHHWGWIGSELSFRDALVAGSVAAPVGALFGGLGGAWAARFQDLRETEPPETPLHGEDLWRLALLIRLEEWRDPTPKEEREWDALTARATPEQLNEAYALAGDPATGKRLDAELREHLVLAKSATLEDHPDWNHMTLSAEIGRLEAEHGYVRVHRDALRTANLGAGDLADADYGRDGDYFLFGDYPPDLAVSPEEYWGLLTPPAGIPG